MSETKDYEFIEKIFSDYKIRELNEDSKIFHTSKKPFSVMDECFSVATVEFLFCGVLNFKKYSPNLDKVHWVIPFYFNDIKCTIFYEKFGLRLHCDVESIDVVFEDIKKKLQKGAKIIRKRITEENVKSIIIPNKYHLLLNMFCKYKTMSTENIESIYSSDNLADILNLKYDFFYNFISYVNPYFSWLEHVFLYIYIFNCIENEESVTFESIQTFNNKKWLDKFKLLFDIKDPKQEVFYKELKLIKERYRNSIAHGCFESKGKSFTRISDKAIMSTRYIKSAENDPIANVFINSKLVLEHTNKIFDGFYDFLKEDKAIFAIRYLECTIDLNLNEANLSVLKDKIDKGFDEFSDYVESLLDRYCIIANCEY